MIDWSKAPSWAACAALDSTGEWHWHEASPELETFSVDGVIKSWTYHPVGHWKFIKMQLESTNITLLERPHD